MIPPILVLDIDGVLNSHDWTARRGHPATSSLDCLDPVACRRVQDVCDRTGAVLLVSSTWRKDHRIAEIGDLLSTCGLIAPVIGMTPSLANDGSVSWREVGRGLEIQHWIEAFVPAEVTTLSVAVVDDGSDVGPDFRPVLVLTDMDHGFIDDHVDPTTPRPKVFTIDASRFEAYRDGVVRWS